MFKGLTMVYCQLKKIIFAILLSSSAWAAVPDFDCADGSDCKIKVQFTGNYSEETCVVSINNASSSESIELPTISTSALKKDGDEAGSVVFNIALKLCPANRVIALRFASGNIAADPATGNLNNSSVGEGLSKSVQIRLRKNTGEQMRIDDVNNTQQYSIPADGRATEHFFHASYYAKGLVTAGKINTEANVILVYP